MVKHLPCNAGNTGLIPGWGTKIPQASEQLNPHAIATEPMPQLDNLCTMKDPT